MKLSKLGVLALTHPNIAALETAILKLKSGAAMLAADTGTARTLPAGWSQNIDFVDVQYFPVGAVFTALIFYADG